MVVSFKRENIGFALFLSVFLFFPSGNYFREYVLLLNLVAFVALIQPGKEIKLSLITKILLAFILLLLLFINIRFLMFDTIRTINFYFREYTELFRFSTIFILLLSNLNYDKEKFYILIRLLIVYVILNSFVSIIEFNNRSSSFFLYTFLKELYQNDNHEDLVLYTMGINSTGATNGLFNNIIYIIFFILFQQEKNNKKSILYILVCIMAFYVVMITGSRANIVGLIFFNVLYVGMTFFFKQRLKKTTILGIVIAILFISFLMETAAPQMIKLLMLFDSDVGISKGLEGREEIWGYYIRGALEYPIGIIIGWGKVLFLSTEGVFFTDNDYLAIFLMYGLPYTILYLVLLIKFCITTLINWNKQNNLYRIIMFYIVITFMVISYATLGINSIHFYVFSILLYKFNSFFEK